MEYRDKIRGEFMGPWAAAEMLRLGLEQVLLDAGGDYSTTFVGYDEDVAPTVSEDATIPLGVFVEGVRGAFCIGHPEACTALRALAERNPLTVAILAGSLAGPETQPPEAHSQENVERILSLT